MLVTLSSLGHLSILTWPSVALVNTNWLGSRALQKDQSVYSSCRSDWFVVQYAVVEDITGAAHMRIQGREVYGATENIEFALWFLLVRAILGLHITSKLMCIVCDIKHFPKVGIKIKRILSRFNRELCWGEAGIWWQPSSHPQNKGKAFQL